MDKNGSVHFVDDINRIPPEYRKALKTYQERYDHLSESEKALMREKDRQKAEGIGKRPGEKNREPETGRKDGKTGSKERVTRVSIKGNHVLVPVKLAFGRKKTTAMLVLDTGAEIIVLHQNVAAKLNIRSGKKGSVKVASGRKVPAKLVKLSYAEAGPIRKKDIHAVVISPQGAVHYDGLLGMNFLKNLDYKIDFDNQVILWRP